jgi:O-succinylbenzoate synthase
VFSKETVQISASETDSVGEFSPVGAFSQEAMQKTVAKISRQDKRIRTVFFIN